MFELNGMGLLFVVLSLEYAINRRDAIFFFFR